MEKKDLRTIAMFCLIGGIVLCTFAQILPWGNIDMTPSGSVIFYSWGMQVSSTSHSELDFYSRFLTDLNSTIYLGSGEYSNTLIPIFFSILIMPVSILGILFAIIDYVFLKRSQVRWGLVSGISIVLAIVFFYIFIQFGLISSNAMISSYYQYTTGFYLMILSAVLFFSAYLITGIGKEND